MADKKTVIETLCSLITTGNEVDRCYASRTLGVLEDVNAIPTLVQCLRDEDIDVSMDAAEALGRIGNLDAIPPLLESLKHDPNGEVKIAVVDALGKIGGQNIIAPLLEIAKSCPDTIAWDDSGDWNDWWDMQLKAVTALGSMRVPEAVPVLINILEDEASQDIESEVLKALALIGGEGETFLIQRLEKGSARERRRAAIALSLSNGTQTRKALARAMTDNISDVRVAAIRALGKLGASQYLDIMLRFLNDPEPAMRRAVIEVTTNLSITGDEAEIMLEKLAPLLTDSNPAVRAATLTALRNIGTIPQEMFEQIRQCLTDSDDSVISAASTLLAHLGDNTILITLLKILSDQKRDINLRSQITTALGILGDAKAVKILTWAIKDAAQPVRLAALNALMQLEKNAKFEPFAEQATPLEIVINALNGKISPTISVPEVQPVQKDDEKKSPSKIEKRHAMSTLEAITLEENADNFELPQTNEPEKVSEEIQEYIDIAQENLEMGERLFVQKQLDVTADVRHLSARILGESDAEQTIKALIAALDYDDPILRQEAANSLGQIAQTSPKIKGLANAFDSLVNHLNDYEMRLACVRTLGLLGNKAAIPALINCLQDQDSSVLIQTIQSLIKIIPTDDEYLNAINAQLIELLNHNDFGVSKTAALALAKLGHIEAIDSIINAAFESALARDMGQALAVLDKQQSSTKLLKMLKSKTNSSHRSFIIEMLEEIFLTKRSSI